MLADEVDYVIGVDTHRDEHVLAVLTAAGRCGRCRGGAASQRARLPGNASFR